MMATCGKQITSSFIFPAKNEILKKINTFQFARTKTN